MRAGLAVLALADSRFPGGGHVHSGGVEEAAARGLITGVADLREFLHGRLRAAGALQAVFAAAAAHAAARRVPSGYWRELDVELDARTPSPAQREASRAQGKGMIRAGRAAWPSPVLAELVAASPRPHHPIVLGVLAATAGAGPQEAALIAGYLAVSGPSSAGVRLHGMDPFAVNAVVADMGDDLDRIAAEAAATAGLDPADLPAPGAPALDLLAESHDRHHREEVRLFAS
ncbi:urease accessory protein [Saccharopolyspora antimicrobica]|uniref:Urease accessory protein n=1 Tax=Saccharopolyspora antimicrobica TaxID=455193 RepID=A0A1I5F6A7_9PSEU|nr:urease accessory UreF family protein [Saccharopolyspora antimicrobica]RKT83700.1 urease accessory protein [Saccharopolyspora antimicrobica]SFO19234.1 urease accessory protein [Saccharopolyspora antimicrobica]